MKRRSSSRARSQRCVAFDRGGQAEDANDSQKKKVASARAEDQKAVDKALLSTIKKEQYLLSYLHTSFSLRNGDKPHEMVF